MELERALAVAARLREIVHSTLSIDRAEEQRRLYLLRRQKSLQDLRRIAPGCDGVNEVSVDGEVYVVRLDFAEGADVQVEKSVGRAR